MPWCEICAKYMVPSALKTDGTCPQCGKLVSQTSIREAQEDASIPWHFKLLVGLLVIYLSWRVIQLLGLIG